MLDYNQREILEDIEYTGMDMASTILELIASPDIETLQDNLLRLSVYTNTMKWNIAQLTEDMKRVGVTEDKG